MTVIGKRNVGDLRVFRDLSSANIKVRRGAAIKLIDGIHHDHIQSDYTLNRLFRGLCSSSQCARQGFASALTILLKQPAIYTDNDISIAMKQCCQLPDSATRQDRKDIFIGRCFSLLVLCESGRLSSISLDHLSEYLRTIGDQNGDWAGELIHQTFTMVYRNYEAKSDILSIISAFANTNTANGLLLSLEISAHSDTPLPDVHLQSLFTSLKSSLPHIHGAIPAWLSSIPNTAFKPFWESTVETLCFNSESDLKSKLLGLGFIESAAQLIATIPESDANQVLTIILSPSAIGLIATSLGLTNASLNKPSGHTLSALLNSVKSSSKLSLLAIQRLGYQFDSRSRSKTISQLMANLSFSDIAKYLSSVFDAVCNFDLDDDERMKSVDILFATLKRSSDLQSPSSVVELVLSYFTECALSSSRVGDRISETCRSRVPSALSHLLPAGTAYVTFVMDKWHSICADDESAAPPFAHEKCWRKAMKLVRVDKQSPRSVSLQLLLNSLAIYSWSNSAAVDTLIADAGSCCDIWYKHVKGKPLDDKFTAVLLDVLTALCAQSAHFLREVAVIVFRSFADEFTAKNLSDLVNQLLPSQQPDGENDGDDDEECDEESEDDDEVESVGKDGDSNDEMKDNDDDDDDEDEDEVVDSDVDAYEAALVNYVRMRQGAKKNAAALKVETVHFKVRIIDLVEQYVRQCSTSPLILTLIEPLNIALQSYRSVPEARPLLQRISALFTKRLFASGCRVPIVDIDNARQFVSQSIANAYKSKSPLHLACARLGVHYALRVHRASAAGNDHDREWVVKEFSNLIKLYTHKKHVPLNTIFFSEILQRNAPLSIDLLPDLVKYAQSARSDFLRGEIMVMMETIVRKHGSEPLLQNMIKTNSQSLGSALEFALLCDSKKVARVKLFLSFASALFRHCPEDLLKLYLTPSIASALRSLPERQPVLFQKMQCVFATAVDKLSAMDSGLNQQEPNSDDRSTSSIE